MSGIVLHCIALHRVALHGMVWYGMVWYGMVLYCITRNWLTGNKKTDMLGNKRYHVGRQRGPVVRALDL